MRLCNRVDYVGALGISEKSPMLIHANPPDLTLRVSVKEAKRRYRIVQEFKPQPNQFGHALHAIAFVM
jgi:hypothetical protein